MEALKEKDPAVIGVFSSAKSKEFRAFEGAAGTLWSDYDFGHVFDASLVPEVRHLPGSTPAHASHMTHLSWELVSCLPPILCS